MSESTIVASYSFFFPISCFSSFHFILHISLTFTVSLLLIDIFKCFLTLKLCYLGSSIKAPQSKAEPDKYDNNELDIPGQRF